MQDTAKWTRIMVMVGLAALILGLLDPLEGSIVLVAGCGLAALSAFMGHSRHRTILFWALGLMIVGVGALWGLSALGGIGGTSDLSWWWGLLMLPYPVGWVMGLVGAFRRLKEANLAMQTRSAAS